MMEEMKIGRQKTRKGGGKEGRAERKEEERKWKEKEGRKEGAAQSFRRRVWTLGLWLTLDALCVSFTTG